MSDTPTALTPSRSLLFDGVNKYIDLPDVGWSGNVNVSMECWVKLSAAHSIDLPAIIDLSQAASTGSMLAMTIQFNRPAIDFGGGLRMRANVALSQAVWHHIVVTKRPGLVSATANVYVDGALVASTQEGVDNTPNVKAGGTQAAIGRFTSTSKYLTGTVSLVRLYADELTAAQVSDLFLNNSVPTIHAWWNLNDD